MVAATSYRVSVPALLKCLVEARPSVLAMYLLRFAAGAALGLSAVRPGTGWPAPQVLGGAVVWVLAVLSAYLLNGVADVREDRANGSSRPIATGALRPEPAIAVAVTAATLALVGAAFLGPASILAVTVLLALGYAYSLPPFCLKRHVLGAAGTGVAAALLSYLAGFAAVAPGAGPSAGTLAFSVVMSLWVGLVGTITKDLPDAPGDAAAGRRTVAVIYGETPLRRVLVLAAGGLGASLWLAARVFAPGLTLPAWALTAGAGVLAVLTLSHLARGGRARKRRLYRTFMATQYVTHLCLLVSVGVPSMVSS